MYRIWLSEDGRFIGTITQLHLTFQPFVSLLQVFNGNQRCDFKNRLLDNGCIDITNPQGSSTIIKVRSESTVGPLQPVTWLHTVKNNRNFTVFKPATRTPVKLP